jgi:hypothetical protein
MKKKSPVYAALDLHSRHSVLGSMEHGGKMGARIHLRPRQRHFAPRSLDYGKPSARFF